MSAASIHYDFASGKTMGTNLIERLGIFLLSFGARSSAFMDFKGFSFGARLVQRFLPSKKDIQVSFADDFKFAFPYADGYWSVLFDNRHSYDAKMETFLKAQKNVSYVLFDCGANFGYVSALVSSKAYGSKPAIAVEADPENFAKLNANATLNDNRFECLNNAIFSTGGEELQLFGAKHEALTLVEEAGEKARGTTITITIDDLLDRMADNNHAAFIVKLDIEGVEIPAMAGATRTLDRDSLLIYEEHGNDPSHSVSKHFKEVLGMRLFDTSDDGQTMTEITHLGQLDAMKPNKRIGYDFYATRSAFWLDRFGVSQEPGLAKNWSGN